ncbi:MAG: hypothetical protein WA160_15410 [Pseudobdellovibrio sp.]
MKLNKLALGATMALTLTILSACGGGGGGGTYQGGGSTTPPVVDSSDIIKYPYETVFGDVCRGSSQPTPGCTFSRATGKRITVSADPTYNSQGYGSDDLWYVKFDSSGNAKVYDDLGNFKYNAQPREFAGFINGSTIGVGTTGAFWENVSAKTYWLGKNGVLYSANTTAGNFGQAINTKGANSASDTNSKAIKSEANVALIKAGADKLVKSFGLSVSKATAIASAMNSIAVSGAERGQISESDINRTFKTAFGVPFNEALAAFKDFGAGDATAARDLTNRSAAALGLKPEQAQEFIKGMYKGALSQWGYNVDQIKW